MIIYKKLPKQIKQKRLFSSSCHFRMPRHRQESRALYVLYREARERNVEVQSRPSATPTERHTATWNVEEAERVYRQAFARVNQDLSKYREYWDGLTRPSREEANPNNISTVVPEWSSKYPKYWYRLTKPSRENTDIPVSSDIPITDIPVSSDIPITDIPTSSDIPNTADEASCKDSPETTHPLGTTITSGNQGPPGGTSGTHGSGNSNLGSGSAGGDNTLSIAGTYIEDFTLFLSELNPSIFMYLALLVKLCFFFNSSQGRLCLFFTYLDVVYLTHKIKNYI